MHLLALVEHPDHVCCRYRLRAFEPSLRAAGHAISYQARPRSWSALWQRPPRADACIIQRRLLPRWELRRLRRRYPLLVFDLDDAIWLRDSYARGGLHSAKRAGRFRSVARAADLIVAGNDFLADHAARLAGRERVAVVPTCVEPGAYPAARHESADSVRLVWLGSSSTLRGLERIAPLLERIGAARRGITLKLICDRFLTLTRMPVETCRWSEQTEAVELAAADIGIAWLPDDDWSRGKCGLKVLQYMAAGLPVIANPVGVQREMITHGETGFLAESADEWIDAVRRLAGDPELRRRMGRAGRERVRREFAVERGSATWLRLLDSLRACQAA